MPARRIVRDVNEAARDVARALAKTQAFAQSRRSRKKVEMLFAHLKRILRLGRLRLRGPSGAQFEFTLAAIAQNLRRLAKLVARPRQSHPAARALREHGVRFVASELPMHQSGRPVWGWRETLAPKNHQPSPHAAQVRLLQQNRPKADAPSGDGRGSFRGESGHQKKRPSWQLMTQSGHSPSPRGASPPMATGHSQRAGSLVTKSPDRAPHEKVHGIFARGTVMR